jgi:hypothetical protein
LIAVYESLQARLRSQVNPAKSFTVLLFGQIEQGSTSPTLGTRGFTHSSLERHWHPPDRPMSGYRAACSPSAPFGNDARDLADAIDAQR